MSNQNEEPKRGTPESFVKTVFTGSPTWLERNWWWVVLIFLGILILKAFA